jgi:hypothetical protein
MSSRKFPRDISFSGQLFFNSSGKRLVSGIQRGRRFSDSGEPAWSISPHEAMPPPPGTAVRVAFFPWGGFEPVFSAGGFSLLFRFGAGTLRRRSQDRLSAAAE